jgi:hypothetical protein
MPDEPVPKNADTATVPPLAAFTNATLSQAVFGANRSVEVWQTGSGKLLGAYGLPETVALSFALAPDGKTLFLLGQRRFDGQIMGSKEVAERRRASLLTFVRKIYLKSLCVILQRVCV